MALEDEMMMEEAMMGERPPMPSMEGANMPRQDLLEGMPPEARGALMEPDEEIEIVLVSRLATLSPEELAMLDNAITPEVGRALIKVLPELAEIIDKLEESQMGQEQPMMGQEQPMMAQEPPMGALGGM
tara:strand:+ start:543 stop:929 length:387 start_codon:yes stop_codon:yes gene_type:complete